MSAEIKQATGIEAELIKGRGGVFDVKADGAIVYSKAETFRFPKPGEVAELLKGK